jgi:hippurate hydrolase
MELKDVVRSKFEEIKGYRKLLNENAELSFVEFNTSRIIKGILDELEIKTETIFNTGVVGLMNEGETCVALRADMDALPVNGVSHACGHDFHMAVVLGTALVLKEIGCEKTVKFIFQPGEEDKTGGALPMINEGVLENPEVKCALSLHVWPGVNVGQIEVSSGPTMASVDSFIVRFIGKGGHAAMPYLCKNPLYPSIDFIQSMNNKLHIENNPLDQFVVTFTSISAGEASNVIADEAIVRGTVRTFNSDLRKKIKKDLINGADASAAKYGCTAQVTYGDGYPPLINDQALTKHFVEETEEILGRDNVLPLTKSFTAEDFAFFAERVPSVHFRLGIKEGEVGGEALHSTKFSASDEALYYGVLVMANFIMRMEEI